MAKRTKPDGWQWPQVVKQYGRISNGPWVKVEQGSGAESRTVFVIENHMTRIALTRTDAMRLHQYLDDYLKH